MTPCMTTSIHSHCFNSTLQDPRTGKRIPAPLQLCASPAFAPQGDPTSGPGTCPAYITISVDGARQTAEFEDSKYPDETVTECGEQQVAGWRVACFYTAK